MSATQSGACDRLRSTLSNVLRVGVGYTVLAVCSVHLWRDSPRLWHPHSDDGILTGCRVSSTMASSQDAVNNAVGYANDDGDGGTEDNDVSRTYTSAEGIPVVSEKVGLQVPKCLLYVDS